MTTWTKHKIADGILSPGWPGFQGTHCIECGSTMNVLGQSYGHKCPKCDPDDKHLVMQTWNHHHMMTFDEPDFGPSKATLQAGFEEAELRSETARKFKPWDIVLVYKPWPCRKDQYNPTIGTIISNHTSTFNWPGIRYYTVLVKGKKLTVNENDIHIWRTK